MQRTTRANRRRNKRLALLAVLLGLVFPASAAVADHEIHFSNEFSVTDNNVTGKGKSQSSLTDGTRFLEVLGINGNGDVGSFGYNYSLGVKGTDDKRNDIKQWSLTNAQARISNKVHTLTLGDTFESFSQYSLSTAVKGGSYKFASDIPWVPEVTILSGIAYPRWDSFCRKEVVERSVTGARVKENIAPNFWVGLNGVRTQDAERRNGEPLMKGDTYGADLEYQPIPGLTLRGETSFSNFTEDNLNAPDRDTDGYAVKVEAVGDADPSRVSLEFEHVSSEYLTLMGSATPDREKAKTKWRYKYSKNLTFNLGFLWYRDNVDSDSPKTFTTNHYKPEAGITVKRLFDRQYLVVDLTYKADSSHNKNADALDHYTNLNYRDRFGFVDADVNLGANYYDADNARKGTEYTYNLSLSSRHTLGPVVLKPQVYGGGWNTTDEL